MASNDDAPASRLADRLVALARMFVITAGAVTATSLAAIVSLQFGFWFMTRRWGPLPVSRLLELVGVDVARPFVLASDDSRLRSQDWGTWFLDLPAAVVLFVLLAVLAAAYSGLTTLDRTRAPTAGQS
jgi:hypothetical protein